MSPLDKALLHTIVHGPDHPVTTMDDEVKDRHREKEGKGEQPQPQNSHSSLSETSQPP